MDIPAKKSLGQNFLKSKVALHKMVLAGEVNIEDTILEVGPGKGVLTEKLLEIAKKVLAVEKDDRLISLLQEKFSVEIKLGKLEIIHGDILDFEPTKYNLITGNYKIIANIPYYITGVFLRKFLETNCQPSKIVVMVQKEIAQRIVANDNKESLLSISVKAYGTPKIIMKVGKENFSPAPKVDSAVLLINNISKNLFTQNHLSENRFFEILHFGFAHKRKMLLGNLKQALGKEVNLLETFKVSGIEEKIRAEDLTLKNWFDLVKEIN